MGYEVKGKIVKIFDTEQKTDKFRAREFVIEMNEGNYPQFIKFQIVQDRCELLDAFAETDEVNVHFDLRGREWNGKYFTNLNAWKIDKIEMETPGVSDIPPPIEESQFPTMDDLPTDDSLDDLPF